MSLRTRITEHMERVANFNVQLIMKPLLKNAGVLPLVGIVIFTAAASMNASAETGGHLPSPFSKNSSSPDRLKQSSSASNTQSSSSIQGGFSEREIKRLNSKGLNVVDAKCASATYRMFIDGENARKYSIREKIVAANFVQSFLKNNDPDLLVRYAAAIEKAEMAYQYDWEQIQSNAKQYGRSLSSTQYESTTEDRIEHKVNEGAKAVFEAIGFQETAGDLDKKIQRYEKKQARAEKSKEARALNEKDERISAILKAIESEMEQPKRNLDFTTSEAREANKAFFNDVIDLLQPEGDDLLVAIASCDENPSPKVP